MFTVFTGVPVEGRKMNGQNALDVRLNHMPVWLLRRIQAAERLARTDPNYEPTEVRDWWQATLWVEAWILKHVGFATFLDHWGTSAPTDETNGQRLFVVEPYASDKTATAVAELAKTLGLEWRQSPQSNWGYGTTRFEFWTDVTRHDT